MVLTANLGSPLAAKFGSIQSFIVGGTIYRGATVVIRQTTGKLHAAIDDDGDVNKQTVVGYALEEAVQKDVDSGGKIRIRMDGKLKRKLSGNPPVLIGRLAVIKDDETIQLYQSSGSGNVVVGRIVEQPVSDAVFIDLTDRPIRVTTSGND